MKTVSTKRHLRHTLARLFILCSFVFVTLNAHAATINQIQNREQTTQTQIVFDFDEPVAYHAFKLATPNRLVIDLPKTTLRANVPTFSNPYLRFRYATTSERLRMVFELKQPMQAQISWLSKHSPAQLQVVLQHAKVKTLTTPTLTTKIKKTTQTTPKQETTDVSENSDTHNPEVLCRKAMVVIDPGHGGKDPGARGRRGSNEKEVVFMIARQLQMQINQQPGMHAVLTRNGDYFIGLRERLRIARAQKADLFIAIHADAFTDDDATGSSVYALSSRGATSEAARWLAEKENFSELGNINLDNRSHLLRSVLLDLSQTATIDASMQLGTAVLQQLKNYNRLHAHKVEQAPFVVLKSPDIPSILVETGFITNPYEERNLLSTRHQQVLSKALVAGIKNYFYQFPPRGTLFASH